VGCEGLSPCNFSDNLQVVDFLSCVFDDLSSRPATCGADNCYFHNLSSAYNTVCNQIRTPRIYRVTYFSGAVQLVDEWSNSTRSQPVFTRLHLFHSAFTQGLSLPILKVIIERYFIQHSWTLIRDDFRGGWWVSDDEITAGDVITFGTICGPPRSALLHSRPLPSLRVSYASPLAEL